MAYAAIALANTAYYVTAAVEHLDGHRDEEGSPSDDIMLLIQTTMGDTDERPIRPKYEKTTYCTRRIEFTTSRTQYICDPQMGKSRPRPRTSRDSCPSRAQTATTTNRNTVRTSLT